MDNVREFKTSSETVAGKASLGAPWASVLRLARQELWKNRRAHLVAAAVALVLGAVAAYMFGLVSGSPGGSPAVAALNLVFLICLGVLLRTGAWASGELSDIGRALSSEGHIAFLKTLPLTSGQIVAARALVAVLGALVLFSGFLGSFYALSEPLREELGVAGLLLFAAFWLGCSLAFEAVGLFTELGVRNLGGFWVYMVLITVLGGVMGGLGADGVDVVSPVIELVRSRGFPPVLVALTLGCGSLAISWLATVRRLDKGGVGS